MDSAATSIPSLLLWTDVHASGAAFAPPLLVMMPPSINICNEIVNILEINYMSSIFQILLSLTSTSLVSILAWAALALLALVLGSRLYVYVMVIIIIVIIIKVILMMLIIIMIII